MSAERRSAWRSLALAALALAAVTTLPYVLAWRATPDGYQFAGVLLNPLDGQSYLAKMCEGWLGAWQLRFPFTLDPHDAAYIYIYYLALGHLARVLRLPLIIIFHAARLAGGVALLAALQAFLSRLLPDAGERRLAFWLVVLGSGLGWLATAFGRVAIDLWVPEAFTFPTLLTNPHFPLAVALMLLIANYAAWPRPGLAGWLLPGLAAVGLALVQPFALAPMYATLAAFATWRIRRDRSWLRQGVPVVAAVVLLSAPLVLYDYVVSIVNPVFAGWSAQNASPTPPAVDVLLGFGLLGLLALPGARIAWRGREPGEMMALIWAAAALALAYAPLALQRRFLIGYEIPLGILAALGLERGLLPWLGARWRRLARGLALGATALGNAYLLLVITLPALLAQPRTDTFALLHLASGEAAAMDWLLVHAPGGRVLAAPTTGAFLPGRAGVRVLAGHPLETVNAELRFDQAQRFFSGQMPALEAQTLLMQNQVDYVFVGPRERALAQGRTPGPLARATAVYAQDQVTIYHLP